jgi:hypothetical protein
MRDGVLQSHDGGIKVNTHNSEMLVAALAKRPTWHLMSSDMYMASGGMSRLGAEFAVDIQEAEYVMRAEHYCHEVVVFMLNLYREYNLVLAHMHADSQVLAAKSAFMLSVG